MSDAMPPIDLALSANGAPVVIVDRQEEVRDMATLLRLAPGVALPAHAADAARLVNHLAHGNEYQLITDPKAFEAAYRAKLGQEDPNAPFRDGHSRLGDFGVPDFAQIKPPRFDGQALTFFVADRALGVPYRVTAPALTAAPVYTPLPMTPIPRPARPAPAPQLTPVSPADEVARNIVRPGDLPR